MATKDSNAQIEVWGWKEKAYNQTKGLSLKDAIKEIIAQTKPMVAAISKKHAAKKV